MGLGEILNGQPFYENSVRVVSKCATLFFIDKNNLKERILNPHPKTKVMLLKQQEN